MTSMASFSQCAEAQTEMSKWLNDGEVHVGQGSGEAVPVSPRMRGPPTGTPTLARGRSPLASPSPSQVAPESPHSEIMGKAKELFVLCDKEGKGFITKRDMQRLQGELPLSPDQLEEVFESLDRQSNGFLTPIEFNTGLTELVGLEDTNELSLDEALLDVEMENMSQDLASVRFAKILVELGAEKLFEDQQEFSVLWCDLQRDRPELLGLLESILIHAVSHLQDSIRERDSLEQALRRRENEHDLFVRSIYEDMETQIREEREKRLVQESVRQRDKGQQLEEELHIREKELENTLTKQIELESRILQLNCEQAKIKEQNQQLRSLNLQLQEHLESGREQLQSALGQLSLLQLSADQEQVVRQRTVMNVSRNIQKEKDSLLRQLELLRDMNKRLRDEKDAQQTQKRTPNISKTLQKKGSIIGNYLQEKPLKRQLSSSDELEQDKDLDVTNSSKRHQSSSRVRGENVEQMQSQRDNVSPQRMFKVVFLGNSGVGKTSFIQRYCTGQFHSKINTTVGIDFQMKTVTLGSTTITMQIWDTAGQERFRSITDQYYRKADGILVMYDLTFAPSFIAVRGWLDTVKEKMCEGTVLILLANKLDLVNSHGRKVTAEEGQRLAEQHQAVFYECSAKTGCSMETLMTDLTGKLVAQHDGQREKALLLTESTDEKSCCT